MCRMKFSKKRKCPCLKIYESGPARVANYDAFMSDELKKFIESEDIKLIGYRAIRDAMRN